MKRCSLFCAGLWPFILLPLLLLLPLLFFKWHAIENDVANNAKVDLASIGAEWADVETTNRGRDVLITGIPPNKAAIQIASDKAEQSYGVNSVEVSSDVRPPNTPPDAATLTAIITGESMVLRGTLADQASIDAINTQATRAFGADNVTNKLRIGSNTAALPDLTGFFLNLAGKSYGLETITAFLNGASLELKGTTNGAEAMSVLVTQMSQGLGLQVESSLTVAEAVVKRETCQKLVNELLRTSKINFASGKSTIEKSSFGLLENIKSTALSCPEASFEVSGHTDSIGNLDFNIGLSEQRAQAVVEHLLKLGLNASNFTAVGYGPSKPIADNATASGRAENRRIEFKLNN